MRNLWAIARKELRNYFDHPTAYILAVVFLVLNNFFFFRSAFLEGRATLRPMFDLLPWFLLFFVPAVTMSSLAEERRSGTLEVLLSHPIRMREILLGKFLGNYLFLMIVLAATLIAPLTLMAGGKFDLGVLLAQYFGTALLVAGMTAVGIFASSLTSNQITAFIVGIAVSFLLMLAGSEVLNVGLPAWLANGIGQLGILTHFYNVTRGVLDLRDIVYFVGLSAAFLTLAYWLLMRERLNHKARLYRNLRLGTAAIVAITLIANLVGRYIPGRLDLTAGKLYTVSPGTRQILGELDDLVTITLYTSKELPTQVKLVQRDIDDVLRDFARYGRGNVQILRKYPDRSEAAKAEAQRLGIQAVQFNVVKREELQLKNGWLGLSIQYADESEVIPFAGDARTLEYQLATDVWKLTRTGTSKVAFITGHGERGQTEYATFSRELGRTYEVSSIDLSQDTTTIAPDIDAIIIGGPRRPVDARSRRMFRNYLANDGRVFYLGSGVDVNLQYLFANAAPDSAVDLAEEFGIRLNKDMVYDLRSNEAITVPGQVFSYVVQYPFWIRALPASDHAITRGLNSVFMPWPSSLDTLPTAARGRVATPLLTTTRFAGAQRGSFQIRPDQQLTYIESDLRPYVLAFALLPSAPGDAGPISVGKTHSDGDAEDGSAAQGSESGQPLRALDKVVQEGPLRGRVVVVGDADFLTDQFVRNSIENIIFGLNAISWLTQSDALLSIRAKSPTPRPLVFESDSTQTFIKYFNLIGVPLSFVLVGILRSVRRRRLKAMSYAT